MKNYNTDVLFILILGLLSMLTPLAIDMYLPSFETIAADLHVSKERIQTTLALFTLGFALGQLLWGPLSDSYGRKATIIVGVIIAAVISLWLTQFLCAAALAGFFWFCPSCGYRGFAQGYFLQGGFFQDDVYDHACHYDSTFGSPYLWGIFSRLVSLAGHFLPIDSIGVARGSFGMAAYPRVFAQRTTYSLGYHRCIA